MFQGFHWTNDQITVHPFYMRYFDKDEKKVKYKTYCVISNELQHDANTVHVFRQQVLRKITSDFANYGFRKVYYISDGAASQYKNFKNLVNLMYHQQDFNLEAEWIFTATSHGKSSCDAMSATVKSTTRRESLRDGTLVLIRTSEEMYRFCVDKLTSSTKDFTHVTTEEVSAQVEFLEDRYKGFKKLTGIRMHHIFRPINNNVIRMERTHGSNVFTDFDFRIGESTTFSAETIIVGAYYAFVEGTSYHIGMLVSEDPDEEDVRMQVLKLNRRTGAVSWPDPYVFIDVAYREILTKVDDPEETDEDNGAVSKVTLSAARKAHSAYKQAKTRETRNL